MLLLALFGLAQALLSDVRAQDSAPDPAPTPTVRSETAGEEPAAANLAAASDKLPFILKNLTYSDEERRSIVTALASLELDFPESPGIRRTLRERATFLGVILGPKQVEANRALEKLTGGAASGTQPPMKVGRFKGSEELSLVLTLSTKPVDSPGASFDDLILSTHLFDLASKIDPANKDAAERLADLRAAGHRLHWDLIIPSDEEPDPKSTQPNETTGGKPNGPELKPVALKRWRSAASALVLQRKSLRDRGSRLPLIIANVVRREEAGAANEGSARPAKPPSGNKRGRPMRLQMVAEGPFELLQMFAGIEGFLKSRYHGWPDDRDIDLIFEGGYPTDDISLQEASCALVVDSLLSNRPLDSSVIVHGDLDDEGNVLPCRQFPLLISQASRHFRLGQTLVVGSVREEDIHDALLLYGPEVFVKVDAIAVKNFENLVEVTESPQLEQIVAARRLYREFQRAAAKSRRLDLFLKTAAARKRLQEILKILPDHVSATALSQYAQGLNAQRVTLRGTYDFVDWMSGTLLHYAGKSPRSFRAEKALQPIADKVRRVGQLRQAYPRPALGLIDSFTRLGNSIIDYGRITDLSSTPAREAARKRAYYYGRYQAYRSKLKTRLDAESQK